MVPRQILLIFMSVWGIVVYFIGLIVMIFRQALDNDRCEPLREGLLPLST